MICRGINCNNESRTKKGWCSQSCYLKNQSKSNSGQFKEGRIIPENELKKISDASRNNWKDPVYRQKMIEILKKSNTPEVREKKSHKKENHPKWKGFSLESTMICKNCGKEFKYITKSKRVRKYCSVRCGQQQISNNLRGIKRTEYVEWPCKICGKISSGSPSRARTGKYCSRKCHNIGNLKIQKTKRTGIELKLESYLKELNIEFEDQKPILLGNTNTVSDFFVKPNIAIYADGKYWHNRPEVVKRDGYINKRLNELGFIVLRFEEDKINKDPSFIKDLLRETICH